MSACDIELFKRQINPNQTKKIVIYSTHAEQTKNVLFPPANYDGEYHRFLEETGHVCLHGKFIAEPQIEYL